MSNSLLVLASLTTSRIQGGGVMGRLSCAPPNVSIGCADAIETLEWSIGDVAARIGMTDLVTKSTHASSDGLLNNVQAVIFVSRLSF